MLLAWPRASGAFLYGNTDIWVMAAVAAGLRWGWPAVFVALKPSLAPLALVGIGHRSWWVGVFAFAMLVPATMALWWDYLVVLTNVRGLGSDYSWGSVPLLLVPVLLWAGRLRSGRPTGVSAVRAGTGHVARRPATPGRRLLRPSNWLGAPSQNGGESAG